MSNRFISSTQSTSQDAIKRRQFLKMSVTGLGLALGATGCASTLSPKVSVENRVGLQLYTVRDMMKKSVADTLKLVASVGYKELEFAGYYDNSPRELKAMIDDLGMTAPSTHVMFNQFEKDTSPVIDAALTMGHNYIVIPYILPQDRSTTISGYQHLAERLNRLGEECKKAGLQLAYHNHDFEFELMDGQVPYDVLLDETQDDLLVMELDLYWTVKAGFDPVAYFKRNPGRFKMWHVKDMDMAGNFADVGTGTIDFARIFDNAALAGVEHKFVERDVTDDMLQTIKQGYLAVSRLNNRGR